MQKIATHKIIQFIEREYLMSKPIMISIIDRKNTKPSEKNNENDTIISSKVVIINLKCQNM